MSSFICGIGKPVEGFVAGTDAPVVATPVVKLCKSANFNLSLAFLFLKNKNAPPPNKATAPNIYNTLLFRYIKE